MADNKVHVGDIGTVIQVDVGEDISAATTTDLKVRKPDGTIETWVGAPNGVINTQIDYTTILDDLDQAGTYSVQSYVVTASWTGRGETAQLQVHGAFK